MLARLKGYSAFCWLMGGGLAGIVVLCRLPLATHQERRKRRRGNFLGLLLSGASLVILWLAREFLK